jgi:hypothetical protein
LKPVIPKESEEVEHPHKEVPQAGPHLDKEEVCLTVTDCEGKAGNELCVNCYLRGGTAKAHCKTINHRCHAIFDCILCRYFFISKKRNSSVGNELNTLHPTIDILNHDASNWQTTGENSQDSLSDTAFAGVEAKKFETEQIKKVPSTRVAPAPICNLLANKSPNFLSIWVVPGKNMPVQQSWESSAQGFDYRVMYCSFISQGKRRFDEKQAEQARSYGLLAATWKAWHLFTEEHFRHLGHLFTKEDVPQLELSFQVPCNFETVP